MESTTLTEMTPEQHAKAKAMAAREQIFTPEQARQVLQAEQQQRLEECQRELDALLKRHGLTLAAQVIVTQDGRLAANVVLVNAQ